MNINPFNECGRKELMDEENNTFLQQQQRQQEQTNNNMFDFWSDVAKLPTVGPFQAFSRDFISYMQEFYNKMLVAPSNHGGSIIFFISSFTTEEISYSWNFG